MSFDPNSQRFRSSVYNEHLSFEELVGRNQQKPGKGRSTNINRFVPVGGSVSASSRATTITNGSTAAPIKLQTSGQPRGNMRR